MKTPQICNFTYDELIRDFPETETLLKPYNPTNDDAIRHFVQKGMIKKGFELYDNPPALHVAFRKRLNKYYLVSFGVEYKRIKGDK